MGKILKIECNINNNSSWMGEIICDGNKIKGITHDDISQDASHLLVGYNSKEYIKILKISVKDNNITSYIIKEDANKYNGNVYLEGQFGSSFIGKCTINLRPLSFFVANENDILSKIRTATSNIKNLNGLGNFLLDNIQKEQQKLEQGVGKIF